MKKEPIVFCWSGGKDSAYALYRLMQDERYELRCLLSTVSGVYKRLSMHGIREVLIEAQAAAIGLPLRKVYVYEASNAAYEREMAAMLQTIKGEGVSKIAFGDIFLEDLRSYREEKMRQVGMDCLFPLWKMDTGRLVRQFIQAGFVTHTCCVNDGWLGRDWVGRKIDESFVSELPAGVDPCGENGEFHSFCTDGPVFREPVGAAIGEITYRPLETQATDTTRPVNDAGTKGFWYCDFLPLLKSE